MTAIFDLRQTLNQLPPKGKQLHTSSITQLVHDIIGGVSLKESIRITHVEIHPTLGLFGLTLD